MVCAEIAMRPMRSPRIAAIGASSTGGRSTARPGSASRKPLTQVTSRKQPDHLVERQHDADQQHADDQRVEPRIGEEAVQDLRVQHDGEQAHRIRNTSIRTRKMRGEESLNGSIVLRHAGLHASAEALCRNMAQAERMKRRLPQLQRLCASKQSAARGLTRSRRSAPCRPP